MNSSDIIINETLDLVTIPRQEYMKLLEYKAICREIYASMKETGGDGL